MGLIYPNYYSVEREILRRQREEYERFTTQIAEDSEKRISSIPSSPIYTDRSTMERKNSLSVIEGPTLIKRK